MLKIFVNTWGNYNENGADGGEWIELPMTPEELSETLERIAEQMGDHDPEWAIHDSEWDDAELFEVGEYDNIAQVNEIINECATLDEWELKEVSAAVEAWGYNISEAIERQQRGCFIFYPDRTLQEVAEELADEMIACHSNGEIPEIFTRYFDYEAFARDLGFDGYEETSHGVILDN